MSVLKRVMMMVSLFMAIALLGCGGGGGGGGGGGSVTVNPIASNPNPSAPVLANFKLNDETTGTVYDLMTSPTIQRVLGRKYTLTGKITDAEGDISSSTTPITIEWVVVGDPNDKGTDNFYLSSLANVGVFNPDGTFSYTFTEDDSEKFQEQDSIYMLDLAKNKSNVITCTSAFNGSDGGGNQGNTSLVGKWSGDLVQSQAGYSIEFKADGTYSWTYNNRRSDVPITETGTFITNGKSSGVLTKTGTNNQQGIEFKFYTSYNDFKAGYGAGGEFNPGQAEAAASILQFQYYEGGDYWGTLFYYNTPAQAPSGSAPVLSDLKISEGANVTDLMTGPTVPLNPFTTTYTISGKMADGNGDIVPTVYYDWQTEGDSLRISRGVTSESVSRTSFGGIVYSAVKYNADGTFSFTGEFLDVDIDNPKPVIHKWYVIDRTGNKSAVVQFKFSFP